MCVSGRWISTFCLLLAMAGTAGAAGMDAINAVARVKIASGPHAGTHVLESDETCTLGPMHKGDPERLYVSLPSPTVAQSDLDLFPNEIGAIWLSVWDVNTAKGSNEFTFAIWFGDPAVREKRGKRMPGTEYSIDRRPDETLDEVERMMRGKSGMHGRGGGKFMRKRTSATFEFWAETAKGVRLDGTIECRRLERSNPGPPRR